MLSQLANERRYSEAAEYWHVWRVWWEVILLTPCKNACHMSALEVCIRLNAITNPLLLYLVVFGLTMNDLKQYHKHCTECRKSTPSSFCRFLRNDLEF